MTKKPPLEKVLVKQIRESAHEIAVLHKYHGGMFGVTGHSDLYGHYKCCGKAIYIEVKRQGNKPTVAQLNFLQTMGDTGAEAFWCDTLAMFEIYFSQHVCQ